MAPPSPARVYSSVTVLLGPMIMRGCMAGSNHLNTFSIEDSTKDTHPAVAPDPLTWRKIPPPLVTSAGVVVRCSLATGSQCTFCGQVVGDDRGVFVLRGISGETFSLSSAPVRVRGLVGLQNVVGLGVSRVVDPIIVAVSVPIRHLCAWIARLAERFPDPVVPCRGRA